MDRLIQSAYTINCSGKLMDTGRIRIMGVLNVTPDSFYDGGRYIQEQAIYNRVEQMLTEGADFIDVGAASTRPGAKILKNKDEWKRIEPALKVIHHNFPDTRISVDTYSAYVAEKAVEEYGACMINDISAGALDAGMFSAIARLKVPYVLMHIKGTPQTMQKEASYADLIPELMRYFSDKINQLREKGVHDIVVDPGFGFGKTVAHNYELLEKLDTFRIFERPVMVGLSRKSMIYKVLDASPEDALNGTIALQTIAVLKGAHILRVHDVKPARETVRILEKYREINQLEFPSNA